MKTIKIYVFVAILLASVQNSKADMWEPNVYRQYAFNAYVAGFVLTPVFCTFWNNPTRNGNGLYISQQFDPGMAIQGKVDLRNRVFYHYERFEISSTYEYFPEMEYQSISLGTDYMVFDRKLSLFAGPEYTRIWNVNSGIMEKAHSFGVNAEIRYITESRWSFSYIANVKSRPENDVPLWFSGYLSINFRITK
jgi:hypothetical protein